MMDPMHKPEQPMHPTDGAMDGASAHAAAAARFRRNARLLCAGSVDVAPFPDTPLPPETAE